MILYCFVIHIELPHLQIFYSLNVTLFCKIKHGGSFTQLSSIIVMLYVAASDYMYVCPLIDKKATSIVA